MSILKADPGRYIKTASGTVTTLIKAAEGGVAILWCLRMVDYLKQLFSGKAGKMPQEILRVLLPKEITHLLLPGRIPGGEMLGKILCWTAAVSISVILICLAAEALEALLLRFALKGAKLFEITHKVLLAALIILLLSTVISCAPLALRLKQSGFKMHELILSGGKNLINQLRPLLVTGCCALLLLPEVFYHWGVVKILSVIEYELHLGFKVTAMEKPHISRDAILLGIIFLAAAVAVGLQLGWVNVYTAALAILAVKYFAVYSCWTDFHRCHR